jgi:hypothetical protein
MSARIAAPGGTRPVWWGFAQFVRADDIVIIEQGPLDGGTVGPDSALAITGGTHVG